MELSRLGLLHHCLRVENDNVVRIDESPLEELTLPLVAADLRRAHHDCAFLDCARRRDSSQCLASSAGQHDDAATCSTIRKHLRQGLLLIVAHQSVGPQLDLEWVFPIAVVGILLNEWAIVGLSLVLQIIQFCLVDANALLLRDFIVMDSVLQHLCLLFAVITIAVLVDIE